MHTDALVVGAGFAGLYMQYRLREMGLTSLTVEKGSDVGGTWYWNRYPGARCDIDSVDYCYSFSPEILKEWRWSERFATQPEILQYLEFVADKLDLRKDIRFSTIVESAEWDDSTSTWKVSCDAGETFYARFLVMGTGNLSEPKLPDIPGVQTFAGLSVHTAKWPREGIDFGGMRVGVIGTGSTGIQAIPLIAEQAAELYVFQRTPNYSMPARNQPLDPHFVEEVLDSYGARRELARNSDGGTPFPPPTQGTFDVSAEERHARFEAGWQRGGINALSYAFTDYFTDEAANREAQEFARAKIREIVHDPSTAEALCPTHHIGTKRTCVDTNYFATYNRPNVTLVDLRSEPIEAIVPEGVRTSEREIALDAIVFAVGFDAMTGALSAISITGSDGRKLANAWDNGPVTYLGLMTAGFPNLFMITGPQSPSVLSNMVVSIEQHVDVIAELISEVEARNAAYIASTEESQAAWVDHVRELAEATLYPQANSWYVGRNMPGKPKVFMPYVGGCGAYRAECRRIIDEDFDGFEFEERGAVA